MRISFFIYIVVFFHSAYNNAYSQAADDIEHEIKLYQAMKLNLHDSVSVIESKIDSLQELLRSARYESISSGGQYVGLKYSTRIREGQSARTPSIIEITAPGDSALVLETYDSSYIKVNYKGHIGYVPIWGLEDEYQEYFKRDAPEQNGQTLSYFERERIRIQEENQGRRTQFVNNNSGLNQRHKDAILNGQLILGMEKELVRASWGDPIDINRTITSNYTREQWVYGSTSSRRYLYFENGVLTTVQD